MSLLQISEPGESPEPHQRKLAVGIDLAPPTRWWRRCAAPPPSACRMRRGRVLLPSVVRYGADGGVEVGYDALPRRPTTRPYIASVKRFMGRGVADVAKVRCASLPVRGCARNGRHRDGGGASLPVQVSAEILKALRARAQESLGASSSAPWSPSRRISTIHSARPPRRARIAGLTCFGSSTSHGGRDRLRARQCLRGDLRDLRPGRRHVRPVILKLTRGVFEVLSTSGDSALGGDDFDQAIAMHWRVAHGLADASAATRAACSQPRAREGTAFHRGLGRRAGHAHLGSAAAPEAHPRRVRGDHGAAHPEDARADAQGAARRGARGRADRRRRAGRRRHAHAAPAEGGGGLLPS